MPVLPNIEPLRRTALDRLEGRSPSLWARLHHTSQQLAPNWNFILKWVSAGAFALTVLTAVTFMGANYSLQSADDDARANRAAHVAEVKRKEKVALVRAAEANEFASLEAHARGNWETWKSQFTTDADGVACAYGHIFNESQRLFEVTCQLGPKGHLPTTTVVCNQSICRVTAPTPTPAPETKK